jgi:hypothetical protein
LDSGTNAPLLYGAGGDLGHLQTVGTSLRGQEIDGQQHAFAVLVGQNVQVGPHSLRQVVFVTPVDAGSTTAKPDVDGLLPTVLFQRVFVDYSDHYVVLEPWEEEHWRTIHGSDTNAGAEMFPVGQLVGEPRARSGSRQRLQR